MAVKHIIVGTAGHVDHGKTALIRALTGIETDRHPEERERGMSIDLGFAHLTLPSGVVAGIVDVPGHERFVHNMLAGASEVDMVLFVVAADEGVMPQTVEHMQILQLLNAKRGIIVITKRDLVDEDWLALVKDEISEKVKGTFLESAPMIAVSSVTGEGLDELLRLMDAVAQEVPPKDTTRPFRLPIDDIFVKAGFGTVVRGAIFSGKVHVGDEVEVVPKGVTTRVRSLHTYGKPVDVAFAGQRAAMNLGGVEREAIERGDVVTLPGALISTDRLDVRLKTLPQSALHPSVSPKKLRHGSPIRFHIGTAERIGRIFFFDRDELELGDETFAEIQLDEPIACAWGDLFVVRTYSPMVTVGGGQIVEPLPQKRRRRKVASELQRLERKARSEGDYIAALLSETTSGLTLREVAKRLFVTTEQARQIAGELINSNIATMLDNQTLIANELINRIREAVITQLRRYHTERPLRRGMPKEQLRGVVGLSAEVFEPLLQRFVQAGEISLDKELVHLPSHEIKLTDEQQRWAQRMEQRVKSAGFAPPELDELLSEFPDRDQALDLLSLLVEQGKLVKVAEFVFHPSAIEQAKQVARQLCEKHGSFTASQFREAINTTRKYAIPLLEFLDHIGLTVRRGDVRVLR
ncbi:MAG: selenocysteine-specific translation elongation factor [Armatimonadetes bacterium]|nr:selenocysteine-specific translation elongation factor [Armatimonadota bacterium]MCX7969669.1 selenocysteine-specific translation elongation factor [Armatimonadota bacterium]MDW8142531.1 selenocysteine-specific translation elongation factor [Armatimonadota bacterium]